MIQDSHVLFVQKRSTRAGAQTSLARMMRSSLVKGLRPAVLIGSRGWLYDHLEKLGIPVVESHFPRLRRLHIQLVGLGGFGKKSRRLLSEKGIYPRTIVANDHSECPLALELSRYHGGVPVVGILRTPGMTQRDFEKFRCEGCDRLLVVGEELRTKVQAWTSKPLILFEEGFAGEELHEPLPWKAEFPERLLVIGSEKPRKGFTDFIHALDLLEEKYPDFPALQCDFTGSMPDDAPLMQKSRRARFRFLGRVNEYVQLVRQYPLAVHPSRAETFGMAPLEAILAGVPTLLSVTGAVDELDIPEIWKFQPSQPEQIAAKLEALWLDWPKDGIDLKNLQRGIMERFHIDHTVAAAYQTLGPLDINLQRQRKRIFSMSSLFKKIDHSNELLL